jgi:ankyrin repeat protein
LLLSSIDIDLNVKDGLGEKPLHGAVINKHEDIARILLDSGSDISSVDTLGYNSRCLLTLNKEGRYLDAVRPQVMALLRTLVSKPIIICTDENYHLLLAVAEDGRVLEVLMLLEKRVSIELRNWERMTPLALAVGGNHDATVRLLFKKGADLQVRDSAGQTLLHITANSRTAGRSDHSYLLLEYGVEVDARDKKGQTVLHIAAISGLDSIKRLMENSSDLDARDN